MSANSLVLDDVNGDVFQRRRDVARWFSTPLGGCEAGFGGM